MAPLLIVDLTSSPEPESPSKALQQFRQSNPAQLKSKSTIAGRDHRPSADGFVHYSLPSYLTSHDPGLWVEKFDQVVDLVQSPPQISRARFQNAPPSPKRRRLNAPNNLVQKDRMRGREHSESVAPGPAIVDLTIPDHRTGPGNPKPVQHGPTPYSQKELSLLKRLKGLEGRSWDEIVPFFPGRSRAALQTTYCTKVKPTLKSEDYLSVLTGPQRAKSDRASHETKQKTTSQESHQKLTPCQDSQIRQSQHANTQLSEPQHTTQTRKRSKTVPVRSDRIYPSSLGRLLRQRELGTTGYRAWSRCISDELRNHCYVSSRLTHQYHGTSGDVACLAWSADGDKFVAASIAISDPQSQQYNMGRNLLLGDARSKELYELPEHHIPRPVIHEDDNVNALWSMRATQDKRLFMSVTGAEFSSSSRSLYTSGADRMVRRYELDQHSNRAECRYSIEHPAAVDLLSIHPRHIGEQATLIATATRVQENSIGLFHCHEQSWTRQALLSPLQRGLLPSSLKFGIVPNHQHLLLAGFAPAKDGEPLGETFLWDINSATRQSLNVTTHNVFDAVWNPAATSASIAFAIASAPDGTVTSRGTRSVIQCFAATQLGCRRVLTWESPAADINDVVFCPYDDNLIAAGATDGRVYIWDQRTAGRSQQPLHVLEHDESLNVLAHDRVREDTDTGVRFTAWGPTRQRLYTGSSDGVVKVWNPYRSGKDVEVDRIAPHHSHRSAVMSGAFSPDFRELLVGTENGRINVHSLGLPVARRAERGTETMKLVSADPVIDEVVESGIEYAQELLRKGEVVVRPCGAMPFRQVLQGPNYQGPYLAPSVTEITEAEERYQNALTAQFELSAQLTRLGRDQGDESEELRKMNRQVMQAQALVTELQGRLDFDEVCRPQAESFQKKLRLMEDDRRTFERFAMLTHDDCKLFCSVLPTSCVEPADDSTRSELRIPGLLNGFCNRSRSDSPSEEQKRRTQQSLRSLGLQATCSSCRGPSRISTENAEPICERCSFTCFRCTHTVGISRNDDTGGTTLTCESCRLSWSAGVLGYELVVSPKDKSTTLTCERVPRVSVNFPDDNDDVIQLDETEHYASLWRTLTE